MREVREAVEFIIELPRKIVDSFMGTRSSYLDWKERVAAQKANAELREVAKVLQSLFFTKFDIFVHVNSPDFKADDENLTWLKGLFSEAAENLDRVREMLIEIGPSHPLLLVEAPRIIANASHAYKQIAELPDEQLRERVVLSDLCRRLEMLTNAGAELIGRLEDQRRLLDHTY